MCCTCVTTAVANQGAFGTEGGPTQLTGVLLLFTVGVHVCPQDIGLEGDNMLCVKTYSFLRNIQHRE